MRRDREIDLLPARIVGRRRESTPTAVAADALLRTAWALRGAAGLAPRGLYRFESFEEAQEWIRRQSPRALRVDLGGVSVLVADKPTLIRTKQTVRPSDAADRAWLDEPSDDERS